MKTSIRYILLAVVVFLSGSVPCIGKTYRIEKAQQYAKDFFHSELSLAFMKEHKDSTSLYIFNRKDEPGFVLVGISDNQEQILGYSETTSFNKENIPEGFLWLMENYNNLLQNSQKKNTFPKKIKGTIEPLVKTKWSQEYPYNNMCPDHCMAGCVPIAFSQVANYYGWPYQGQGAINSQLYVNGVTKNIAIDFSRQTYNWYDPSNNLYAKFIYHIGACCVVQYGTDGTGGRSDDAAVALYNYFKYKRPQKAIRSSFTTSEWDDLIYSQLSNSSFAS